MFDMRYHIASLIAVFFALAIGILLGTVIVDKGILVEQQQALVKRIEGNFSTLREENRMLREEVSEQREFANQVTPLTIKERLVGKNVAVIVTTAVTEDAVEGLLEGIKKAGGTAMHIDISDEFEVTDKVIAQLQPYFVTKLDTENARDLMINKMVEDLTKNPAATTSAVATTTTTAPVATPYLAQLVTVGFIKTDANFTSLASPVNVAVVVGGAENVSRDPLKTDVPVIAMFKTIKVRVIGAETTDCEKSYIKAYQAQGIPTVDNVNQPVGVISAVFAIAGADGNFGIKETAKKRMPSPSAFSMMSTDGSKP